MCKTSTMFDSIANAKPPQNLQQQLQMEVQLIVSSTTAAAKNCLFPKGIIPPWCYPNIQTWWFMENFWAFRDHSTMSRWTPSCPQKRKPGMPPRCRRSFCQHFLSPGPKLPRFEALLQKKNKMLEEALQLALKAQEKAISESWDLGWWWVMHMAVLLVGSDVQQNDGWWVFTFWFQFMIKPSWNQFFNLVQHQWLSRHCFPGREAPLRAEREDGSPADAERLSGHVRRTTWPEDSAGVVRLQAHRWKRRGQRRLEVRDRQRKHWPIKRNRNPKKNHRVLFARYDLRRTEDELRQALGPKCQAPCVKLFVLCLDAIGYWLNIKISSCNLPFHQICPVCFCLKKKKGHIYILVSWKPSNYVEMVAEATAVNGQLLQKRDLAALVKGHHMQCIACFAWQVM